MKLQNASFRFKEGSFLFCILIVGSDHVSIHLSQVIFKIIISNYAISIAVNLDCPGQSKIMATLSMSSMVIFSLEIFSERK